MAILNLQVLITKLRSANSAETQQYRKASKALLVLIPLLGVTYILTMVGPTDSGTYANYYSYGRATLLSTQVQFHYKSFCFIQKTNRPTNVFGVVNTTLNTKHYNLI